MTNQDRQGQELGIWKLDRPLGRGGMAEVWLAHRIDGVVEQAAALKVLRPACSSPLQDEAAMLRSISHRNIVRYFDSGTTPAGQDYLAMEYVEGRSITEHADQKGLSVSERLRLFLQVCDAVAYAHLYLILHLDIKPANILVTTGDLVKVVDFGLARRLYQGPDSDGRHSGTYSSPEQVRAESALGFAADIYGLGATLYELLCGHAPFNPCLVAAELERQIAGEAPLAPSQAINQARVQLGEGDRYRRIEPEKIARMRGGACLAEVRGQLAGSLDRICLYALRKEPSRRYQTVDDFRTDIHRTLQHLPPEFAHSNGPGYLAWRAMQRRPLLLAAAVFAISAGYSQYLVSKSQSASRRARVAIQSRVDVLADSTLRELTRELRPRLASDPRLLRSLEVLESERSALTVPPGDSSPRHGDSIGQRFKP